MEWWVWVLVAAILTLLGWAKLKLFSKLMKKKKTSAFRDEDELASGEPCAAGRYQHVFSIFRRKEQRG